MRRMKIVYYTDVLCGWCYGFSPVIKKIYQNYQGLIDFEVISGGLFIGDRTGFINDVAPHIKAGAYKQVEAMTGVKFGPQFINHSLLTGTMTLDSLPHAIAIIIVKEKFPDKAIEFSSLLHKAVYYDGLDSRDMVGLARYARKVGCDEDEFLQKLADPAYAQQALLEFEAFRAQGLHVFPSLVLKTTNPNEDDIVLSKGSISYQQLADLIDAHLEISSE